MTRPTGTFLTGLLIIDGQPTTYCSTECASHRCTRPCGRVTDHPDDEHGHLCDDCASALAGWF